MSTVWVSDAPARVVRGDPTNKVGKQQGKGRRMHTRLPCAGLRKTGVGWDGEVVTLSSLNRSYLVPGACSEGGRASGVGVAPEEVREQFVVGGAKGGAEVGGQR